MNTPKKFEDQFLEEIPKYWPLFFKDNYPEVRNTTFQHDESHVNFPPKFLIILEMIFKKRITLEFTKLEK